MNRPWRACCGIPERGQARRSARNVGPCPSPVASAL
jgi:hypothetical protein